MGTSKTSKTSNPKRNPNHISITSAFSFGHDLKHRFTVETKHMNNMTNVKGLVDAIMADLKRFKALAEPVVVRTWTELVREENSTQTLVTSTFYRNHHFTVTAYVVALALIVLSIVIFCKYAPLEVVIIVKGTCLVVIGL